MKNARMDEFKEQFIGTSFSKGVHVHCEKSDQERGTRSMTGVVKHKLGYADFSQYHSRPTEDENSARKESKWLFIEIIHNGHLYYRFWDAWYGKRTIARLANEFIEEIKGGHDE